MENFSYHVPVYVVTGGVATQGHSSTIGKGAVALIDRQTWHVATPSGNGTEFFFAQGSFGGFDWNANPVTDTLKSPYFYGKGVSNMYKSLPARLVNEEWVLGYDGSASSVGLSYEAGKSISIKFVFSGDPIYRKFGGPKEYRIAYTPPVDCNTDDCIDDCGAGPIDCRDNTITLINMINTHVELRNFGVTAQLVSNLFVAGTPDMTKYCLALCDEGDPIALQAVQNQVSQDYIVVRTSRVGSTSTYQFCSRNAVVATLGSVTTTGSNPNIHVTAVAVTSGGKFYSTAPTVAFTGGTGTAATAHAVLTNGVVTSIVVDTPGAYSVAPTAATLTGGSAPANFTQSGSVYLATCGSCAAFAGSSLVPAKDTYIIKRAVTPSTDLTTDAARDAFANTVGAAYATATSTSIADADETFLGLNGAVALVQVKFPAGTVVTALAADTVSLVGSEQAKCTLAAPSSIAWASCGTGISSTRTLKTKLSRPDCDANGDRIADLTALLSGFTDVDLTTLTLIAGVGCIDEYTVTQKSNDCLEEGCLTENVTFHYNDIPSLDGAFWDELPSSASPDFTRKCGIRVTAGFVDPTFGNCSFDPKDYYNDEPVRFELAILNEEATNCDYASSPTYYRSRVGQIQRQTGEWVVREVIMKNAAYMKHIAQFDMDPRMREAFDENLLNTVDRKAFYILYYISFNDSFHKMDRKAESEKFTAVFAIKESDPAQFDFEAGPIAILEGKSGVGMHVNA